MLVSDILMKIDRSGGENACWRYSRRDGYPTFTINGKAYRGSRFIWQMVNGPIPAGYCICHRCDMPWCVNPKHLFCGTYKDNSQDARRKGRLGRRHPKPIIEFPNRLRNTKEVARMIGTSYQRLSAMRRKGKGPAFIKIGGVYRYRPETVAQWLAEQEATMPRAGESSAP